MVVVKLLRDVVCAGGPFHPPDFAGARIAHRDGGDGWLAAIVAIPSYRRHYRRGLVE